MGSNFDQERRNVLNQLKESLSNEIQGNLGKLDLNFKPLYYNDYLGDTSFFLAAFLEFLLEHKMKDWNSQRWFDDSLITRFSLDRNKLTFWGIMIWGIDSDTEEWTDPFYCELNLSSVSIDHYLFLFGDKNLESVPYSFFHKNPDQWKPIDRKWKYEISSNQFDNE